MSYSDSILRNAFDPDAFQQQGERILERLSTHLSSALAGNLPAVLPWRDPEAMLERWRADFDAGSTGLPGVQRGLPGSTPPDPLGALVGHVLEDATQLHHPGFVGHQVAPPLPLAVLCDMVSSFTNNGMAVYEMGQAGTAMELHVVRWMADALGLGDQAGGVLTSGGTLATLTALLAMRQARAGWDVWTQGAPGGPPPCVLVSEQAHYCADRAVRIMGWGEGGLVRIPVDERWRMRVELLPEALARAEAAGRRVLGVVASACSTATGSFDPLEPIADFCEARGLWMHVDGAHGAALALSSRHRGVLAGIERADSVVWDAHKMLLQPALVTAVLFRDAAHSAGAFAQDASYLLGPRGESAWCDLAGRTFECTKRMMSLKLYATLLIHGPELLDAYVTRVVDLAREFSTLLRAQPDFEVAVEPEANIVCFRHIPHALAVGRGDGDVAAMRALDHHQVEARMRVIQGGHFYLVQTLLNGRRWLRTTLMHPFTTVEDLERLIVELRGGSSEGSSP
jgi:L-2,4-diaminobutyrate decarboxylase